MIGPRGDKKGDECTDKKGDECTCALSSCAKCMVAVLAGMVKVEGGKDGGTLRGWLTRGCTKAALNIPLQEAALNTPLLNHGTGPVAPPCWVWAVDCVCSYGNPCSAALSLGDA